MNEQTRPNAYESKELPKSEIEFRKRVRKWAQDNNLNVGFSE